MQQWGLSFHQGLHTPVYILSVWHRQVKEAMSYSLDAKLVLVTAGGMGGWEKEGRGDSKK